MHGNVRDDSKQHRINDECTKINPRFLRKISQKFSAWIRVPDHRVLMCGSLQIKVKKKSQNFVHLVLGPWLPHSVSWPVSHGVLQLNVHVQYMNMCTRTSKWKLVKE